MEKRAVFLCTLLNVFCISAVIACPCGFSPNDQRPFFEQYEEIKKDSIIEQEKEE